MATIERREQTPGKVTHRVRWWADGKQRSKSFGRFDEANRFKALLEGDMANGTYVDPKAGKITVASYAGDWIKGVNHLRATSLAQLNNSLFDHVVPHFGSLPITAVTHQAVAGFVTEKMQTCSASTVRKMYFALRSMLRSALRDGLIKANPADGVSLPTLPRHEQRFLNREEVNRLVEAMDDRYKALVMVAVYGGLRSGEISALRRNAIDPMRNTIRVRQTLVYLNGEYSFGPPKTRTSLRTVTLPRSVMAALVEHMDRYTDTDPEGLVFTMHDGRPVLRHHFRRTQWVPALKRAGIPFLRVHDLRHTFVALWVSLGRNAKEVSKAAGHCSVAFTLDRYGHLYEVDDDGLADELDRLLA